MLAIITLLSGLQCAVFLTPSVPDLSTHPMVSSVDVFPYVENVDALIDFLYPNTYRVEVQGTFVTVQCK